MDTPTTRPLSHLEELALKAQNVAGKEGLRIGFPDLVWWVGVELSAQHNEHGESTCHPDVWNLIVGKQMGDLAKALLARQAAQAQHECIQAMACLAQLYHSLATIPVEVMADEQWRSDPDKDDAE